jgi:hypothetical protein
MEVELAATEGTKMTDKEQEQAVIDLSKKLLKAAGNQSPVTMMMALLMCMRVVEASTVHIPKEMK